MRSYTIGRVWDIPIRINVSLVVFLPILVWLIASGGQIELYADLIGALTGVGFDLAALRAGSTPWLIGLVAAVGLFASVTLHELGHSWVALRYGIGIESITLWILGGLAALTSIPKEWNREFWIAIAGPITSVLVAVACYGGLLVAPESMPVPRFLLGWLALTNVTLAVFNLLPAFPMDGGRVLRALLARRHPYGTATRIAARVGVAFAFLFAFVGVLYFNVIMLLLAFFVYGAATTESQSVLLDELLEGITVGDIMTRDPETVPASATVEELGQRMLQDRRTVHLVTDGAGEAVGLVTIGDLKKARQGERSATRVEEIMQAVSRIEASADAFDTLASLNQSGTRRAIVEQDGQFVGVLSEEDYAHALTVRRGFQGGIAG